MFPTWIFSKNIILFDKISFFLPYIIFYFFLFFILKKEIFFSKIQITVLSVITIFALDQNILFNLNFVKPYFGLFNNLFPNIYFADFIIIIIFFILSYFLIFYLKTNAIKFYFIFFSIFIIINIYNSTLNNKIKFLNFNKSDEIIQNYKSKNKTLLLVLDEMSGFNSPANQYKYADEFIKNVRKFSINNDLNLYTNSFTISADTMMSLTNMLNFNISIETELFEKNYIVETKKYFNEFNILKNEFFNKFENISVIQNIQFNYCLHPNIKNCYQFNPYLDNKYHLEGFKKNYLTKFSSLWKLEGSSIAKLFWRGLRQLEFIDSYLEPEIHKSYLPLYFYKIEENLLSNKYDLVFAHLLTPHVPFGFNKKCHYDGKRSILNTRMSIKEKFIQHNIERNCMITFLINFFEKIKKSEEYSSLNIIIMSDHASRITEKDKHSTFIVTKIGDSVFLENNEKISIQTFFKELFQN
ncbi:MAG: hypothetical protein CMI80_00510 [Candidatus Pelagibacter sp.]|nr:hypothetical protein [Candidatus Pelagibacter sp.]